MRHLALFGCVIGQVGFFGWVSVWILIDKS